MTDMEYLAAGIIGSFAFMALVCLIASILMINGV